LNKILEEINILKILVDNRRIRPLVEDQRRENGSLGGRKEKNGVERNPAKERRKER